MRLYKALLLLGVTRNQFVGDTGTWVRIPPRPPMRFTPLKDRRKFLRSFILSVMRIAGDNMSRTLYNATVIPEIIKLIAEKYNLSERDAMDAFYKSDTVRALNDPETGLYGQSALFIFSQYVMEKER